MVSEIVERVARVIGASYEGYADPIETPDNWIRAISAARDAIAAMREPTDGMLVAAEDAVPCLASFAEREASPSYLAWQAMIDWAVANMAASNVSNQGASNVFSAIFPGDMSRYVRQRLGYETEMDDPAA